MRSRLAEEKSLEYVLAARWPEKTRTPMDLDPDSLSVSTWPRRTSVENPSPSRTTHSAAVAPPFMARRTISWARERRSVSNAGALAPNSVEGIKSLFILSQVNASFFHDCSWFSIRAVGGIQHTIAYNAFMHYN